MERSMNGRPLPEQGPKMAAILAYLKFIGAEPAAAGRAVPKLRLPQRAADPVHGQAIYRNTCSACHGPDGAGVRYSQAEQRRHQRRYSFPPLLGPFSRQQHALGPWPPIMDWLKTHAPPPAQAPPVVD
jgi:thiosulfate dehydrogenase